MKRTMLYSPSFIAMSFANLFTVSSFGTFFLFPLFIRARGGSESDIGIIMGVFSLSAVLCRPWVSDMVDRIGRKRSYTIGCLIMSVLPLTYLLLQGRLSSFYYAVLVARIIHGIGLAICFTASFTYIADIVPQERLNEGIGMFGLTGLIGLALGPVIGEIIILKYGFPFFFVAATLIAILGLLSHLHLPDAYTGKSPETQVSFFSVLVRRKILTVAVLAFLFGFGLAATGNFVSPFAKDQGLAFISLYYICYSLSAVVTRLLGGRLADRVGEARIIVPAIILTGGGLFIMVFLGGPVILILSGLVSGCGHGFLFPCLSSIALRNEPVSIRGKINGAFTGGIDTGAFIGSFVLGYIGEWAGFQVLFFAAGLVLFSGLCVHRLSPVDNG